MKCQTLFLEKSEVFHLLHLLRVLKSKMEMNKQKKNNNKKKQRLNSNIMVDKVGKLSELIIIITGKWVSS